MAQQLSASSGVGDIGTGDGVTFSEDETNGLILQGYHVPEEILVAVLSLLDCDTLLKCRQVCHLWKYTINTNVWRLKMKKETYQQLHLPIPGQKYPWYVYFWICKRHPFGRNLLKNHCGQDKLQHWTILSNGGNGWKIEDPPVGSDELPHVNDFDRNTSCFSTSYHSCSKEQLINLQSEGCAPKVMDELQPCIEVSEWYAGRFDCGCVYELQVELLNEAKEVIVDFSFRTTVEQWQGREWQKVHHKFHRYGPGVRYIKFYHGGTDTQFWGGNYGSKMAGACVKVMLQGIPTADVEDEACMLITEDET